MNELQVITKAQISFRVLCNSPHGKTASSCYAPRIIGDLSLAYLLQAAHVGSWLASMYVQVWHFCTALIEGHISPGGKKRGAACRQTCSGETPDAFADVLPRSSYCWEYIAKLPQPKAISKNQFLSTPGLLVTIHWLLPWDVM